MIFLYLFYLYIKIQIHSLLFELKNKLIEIIIDLLMYVCSFDNFDMNNFIRKVDLFENINNNFSYIQI